MYVENKNGDIDGVGARIGWVSFSKTGRTIYYRGRSLKRLKGGGIAGNYYDEDTHDEYWISGVKKDGNDSHWSESVSCKIDDDAKEEYEKIVNEKSCKNK